LDNVTIDQALQLGYTPDTWDNPGTNTVERIGFVDQAMGQQVLLDMGFTGDSWDCYMNHYLYYDWEDLKEFGVQEYMISLGWTPDNWGDTFNNLVYDLDWSELTNEQRGNATEICYFEQLWDKTNLQEWTLPPSTTSSSEGSPTPVPKPSSSSTTDSSAAHSFMPLIVFGSSVVIIAFGELIGLLV